MEQVDRFLTLWLSKPWVSPAIFAAAAIGCLVGAVLLIGQQRRLARIAPRMEYTRGIVRECELIEMMSKAGSTTTTLKLAVDFTVGDAGFCCHRFELYQGSPHRTQMQEAASLRPGEGVRVWYDRQDPRVCSLIVGSPSYVGGYIVLALAVLFTGLAVRAGIPVFAVW